jgi:hypothetical protein
MGLTNEGRELHPEIGDLICLIAGGPVPFMLRKEGDKSRFLRACYLGGLMNAKAQPRVFERGAQQDYNLK